MRRRFGAARYRIEIVAQAFLGRVQVPVGQDEHHAAIIVQPGVGTIDLGSQIYGLLHVLSVFAIAIIFSRFKSGTNAADRHVENFLVLGVSLLKLLVRGVKLSACQAAFHRIYFLKSVYLLLRPVFAAACDPRRIHEIANEVALRFEVIRIQIDGQRKLAAGLPRGADRRQCAQASRFFRFAPPSFP